MSGDEDTDPQLYDALEQAEEELKEVREDRDRVQKELEDVRDYRDQVQEQLEEVRDDRDRLAERNAQCRLREDECVERVVLAVRNTEVMQRRIAETEEKLRTQAASMIERERAFTEQLMGRDADVAKWKREFEAEREKRRLCDRELIRMRAYLDQT